MKSDIVINLYDLKKVVDKMIYNHEHRINSMSNRAMVMETVKGIEFHQYCEYPECYPDINTVERMK